MAEIVLGYPNNNVIRLNAKDLDYGAFGDLFISVSMFGEKQLVLVEGKIDSKQVDWEKIVGESASSDLLIWIDQQLRSNDSLITKIKELAGVVEFFEEEPDSDIFGFLESVATRNRKSALNELQVLFDAQKDPIYIQTMLVWQFRNILVPDLAKGYVQQKAQKHRANFSDDELLRIYQRLYEMEVALKTGAEMPEVLIEQFVVKICR